MSSVWAASAIAAIVCALPATASAQGSSVVVIPVTGEPTEAGPRVTHLLVEAGNQSGSKTTAAQADQADVLALAGCDAPSPQCWEQVRVTLNADAVIVGSVEPSTEPPGSTVNVTIYRDGTEPATRSYQLQATEPAGIETEFEPMAKTVFTGEEVIADDRRPPPPPPETDRGAVRFDPARVKTHSWIIAGAGAGTAIVGGVFLVIASGKQDDVDNAPVETVEDLERLEDLENSGQRYTTLGNAFLIAGTLAAITGGVLIGIQGIHREPVETPPVAVGPMSLDGDIVGVSLGGWF